MPGKLAEYISKLRARIAPIDYSPPPPPPEPKQGSEPVFVYIWNTSSTNGVGHAALQVGGDSPKYSATDKGTYASFWPGFLPSVGIFSIIPGVAYIATSMGPDMAKEADGMHCASTDFSVPSLPEHDKKIKAEEFKKPDVCLRIEGLDTQAMLRELKKQQSLVEEGRSAYQLFPNVTVVDTLLSQGAALVGQDPVDCHQALANTDNEKKVYNCTTFTSKILSAGGMKITPNRWSLWGLTPQQLETKIQNSCDDDSKSNITVKKL